MTSRIPEPTDAFEDEGVPATESPLPSKVITGDEQDGMAPPADRPTYSDGYGVTAAEQARGETIDAYLAAEEPDVLDPIDRDPDERVGRIVETDEGARSDTDPDAVGSDVGTDGGGFSAEELAMHVEPEA